MLRAKQYVFVFRNVVSIWYGECLRHASVLLNVHSCRSLHSIGSLLVHTYFYCSVHWVDFSIKIRNVTGYECQGVIADAHWFEYMSIEKSWVSLFAVAARDKVSWLAMSINNSFIVLDRNLWEFLCCCQPLLLTCLLARHFLSIISLRSVWSLRLAGSFLIMSTATTIFCVVIYTIRLVR